MASLIFSQAKGIRQRAKKYATAVANNEETLGKDYKEAYESAYACIVRTETEEFKAILNIAKQLHEVYTDTVDVQRRWYFITIRPDETKTTLLEFIKLVSKYVQRRCFKEYTLTFEQKGTDEETLGRGYHAHIVSCNTWRSKGEGLRDTISTFRHCVAPNCIEIRPTTNPDDIVNDYLVEYTSTDGHKELTKEMDALWRDRIGIQTTYTEQQPIALPSSPVDRAIYLKTTNQEPVRLTWS